MTFRKKTVDSNVRYIPKREQTKERDRKPKQQKLVHYLVTKTKNYHNTKKMGC